MRNRVPILLTGLVCLAAGYLLNGPWVSAQGGGSGASIAAIPNQKGGQDVFGAYDVVADWPKDLATIPGHEGWTYGAGSSVFAESADRIYAVQHAGPFHYSDREVQRTQWVPLAALDDWIEGHDVCDDSIELVVPKVLQ